MLRCKKFVGNVSLKGKTVLITGANCGLGLEAAFDFARRGGKIILACRDGQKGEQAAKQILDKVSDAQVIPKILDLASFKSIRAFADQILREETKLDILVNNAGVFQCEFMKTEDDLEMQMGTNHMGHFLLTNLLLDLLKKSAPSRVVVVSSGLSKYGKIDFDNLNSEKEYNRKAGYNNSKLANNYFARELASMLEGSGVDVYCLCPGMVRTNLGRHVVPTYSLLFRIIFYPLYYFLVKSPWEGIQTILHCSLAPELTGESGKMYRNCEEKPWFENSKDLDIQKKLWSVSKKVTQQV